MYYYAQIERVDLLPKLFAKAPRARWGTRRMPTAMMLFAAKVLAQLPPSLQKASSAVASEWAAARGRQFITN